MAFRVSGWELSFGVYLWFRTCWLSDVGVGKRGKDGVSFQSSGMVEGRMGLYFQLVTTL